MSGSPPGWLPCDRGTRGLWSSWTVTQWPWGVVMERGDVTADVVVVGAGYSGLSAARSLVDAGLDVVVVEARDRVGGRVHTVTTPTGAVVDHGGQWLGPGQEHLASLAAEIGVETFPTWTEGSNIELRAGERYEFTGLVPTSDPGAAADAIAALLDLDLAATAVDLAEPWTHPDADDLDRTTLASWVEQNVEHPVARDMVTTAVLGVFGVQPAELSLLYVLAYAHGGGSLSALVRTTGGAQERRFVGGAQQMAVALAEGLGTRVVLDAPVSAVGWGLAGVTVTALRRVGGADPVPFRVVANRAVVAMPPAAQARIAFDPPLPPARAQLIQRVPMGSVTKFHAVYERPFWREAGLSGQVLADAGAARIVFDDSPPDASHGVLVGFIAGGDDRRLFPAGPEGRREAVLGDLAAAFGPEAGRPSEFVDLPWAAEPYTGGAPVACLGTGVLTGFGPALRRPVGPIHWAGTEVAEAWSGYIDGAISSGKAAAADVLASIGGEVGGGAATHEPGGRSRGDQ